MITKLQIITTIKLGELSLNISKPKLYPASWIDRKHSSAGKRDQIAFSEVFITEVVTFSSFKMGKKTEAATRRSCLGDGIRLVSGMWVFYGLPMALVSLGATRQSPLYHLAIIYPELLCVSAHLCLHHTWPLTVGLALLQRRENGRMTGEIFIERREMEWAECEDPGY